MRLYFFPVCFASFGNSSIVTTALQGSNGYTEFANADDWQLIVDKSPQVVDDSSLVAVKPQTGGIVIKIDSVEGDGNVAVFQDGIGGPLIVTVNLPQTNVTVNNFGATQTKQEKLRKSLQYVVVGALALSAGIIIGATATAAQFDISQAANIGKEYASTHTSSWMNNFRVHEWTWVVNAQNWMSGIDTELWKGRVIQVARWGVQAYLADLLLGGVASQVEWGPVLDLVRGGFKAAGKVI